MSKVAFLVWLLVLTPCFLFAQDSSKSSVDPSGTWRWEYDLDGTQFKDSVRLKVGQENKETKERELKGPRYLDGIHILDWTAIGAAAAESAPTDPE